MELNVIKVDNSKCKMFPFVSIGRGMLDFNAQCCKMIKDEGQYTFAQFLKGKEGKKTIIAIKFLTSYEPNSIKISRKNKNVRGIIVRNKGVIFDLFGKKSIEKKMIRYNVEKIDNNILSVITEE